MDWKRICIVNAIGLSIPACIVDPSSIGDLETQGSTGTSSGSSTPSDDETSAPGDGSTSTGTGTSTSTSEESSEGEPTTGGPLLSCPEFSQCSHPLTCAPAGTQACGHLLAGADANGCPRPFCDTDDDCPADYSCNFPYDWGACGNLGCYDIEDGSCECTFGLPCFNDGQCVPDDVYPPPGTNGPDFCGTHTDQASCDAVEGFPAGHCRWYEGFEMSAGQLCEERVPIGQCVFISSFQSWTVQTACPSDARLFPMVREEGSALTVLMVDPQEPPFAVETTPLWNECGPLVAQECTCGCP